MKALEKKGYISREENRSRAIQLADLPNQTVPMPILRERRAIDSLRDPVMMENRRTLAICSKPVIICSVFVGMRGPPSS